MTTQDSHQDSFTRYKWQCFPQKLEGLVDLILYFYYFYITLILLRKYLYLKCLLDTRDFLKIFFHSLQFINHNLPFWWLSDLHICQNKTDTNIILQSVSPQTLTVPYHQHSPEQHQGVREGSWSCCPLVVASPVPGSAVSWVGFVLA